MVFIDKNDGALQQWSMQVTQYGAHHPLLKARCIQFPTLARRIDHAVNDSQQVCGNHGEVGKCTQRDPRSPKREPLLQESPRPYAPNVSASGVSAVQGALN